MTWRREAGEHVYSNPVSDLQAGTVYDGASRDSAGRLAGYQLELIREGSLHEVHTDSISCFPQRRRNRGST
jgi:hypothetical protein